MFGLRRGFVRRGESGFVRIKEDVKRYVRLFGLRDDRVDL